MSTNSINITSNRRLSGISSPRSINSTINNTINNKEENSINNNVENRINNRNRISNSREDNTH